MFANHQWLKTIGFIHLELSGFMGPNRIDATKTAHFTVEFTRSLRPFTLSLYKSMLQRKCLELESRNSGRVGVGDSTGRIHRAFL